jgi:hypothetical protein
MNVEFVCGKLDTGLLGCVTCKDTAAALRCSEGFCGCVPAMQPMLLVTLDLQANLMLLSQTTMAYRGSDLSIPLTTVLVLATLDKRYLCQTRALQADCARHVISRRLTCSFLSCIALFRLRSQRFVVTD